MAPRRAEKIDAGCGRERLLQAAMHLFASKGYAAASVRDIVNAAGVTAPSLYHHFGNKEGLFLAVMRATESRISAAEEEAMAGGGVGSRSHPASGSDPSLTCGRNSPTSLGRSFSSISERPKEASLSGFRELILKRIQSFERLVEEGVASGESALARRATRRWRWPGALDIASRPHLLDSDHGGSDEALKGALAVILSGITPSAPADSTARPDAPAGRQRNRS